MPILINSTSYTDDFGNVTPGYKSNSVDRAQVTIEISANIRMSSLANSLVLDPSLNQVTSGGTSWIDEGFRVGDWCYFKRCTSGGSQINIWWSQIVYVDDILCDFTSMPFWYNQQNSEFVTITAVGFAGSKVPRLHADLDVMINHVKNNVPGSEFSLIDGEVTRAIFTGVSSMAVNDTIVGTFVGNLSGQFPVYTEFTRLAYGAGTDGFNHFTLTIIFMQSGMYDDTWFSSSQCLKFYMKMEWASINNDPLPKSISILNAPANTGRFDQAHNTSVADSTLVTAVTGEIDYCIASTHEVVVDGPLAELAMGAAYRSITDSYYRNRPYTGQSLAMVRQTTGIAAGSTFFSNNNPDGAGYSITINTIGTVGTVHTINFTITPNATFTTFMGNVEEDDRLFYVWVKCGNINHLVYEDQLTCAPPVGGPLIMVQDHGYLDHSQNVETATGDQAGFEADTEDNIAYVGRFLLDKEQIYESFAVRIEAHNTVTDEDFTLQQAIFGFGSVQISASGVYLLDETQNITTELPTTSVKRDARLTLDATLDTATEFGVKIYAPWLLNWRSWLPLTSANVAFYPTQNQDWEQYDNVANWEIRTHLELIKEGLAYVHENVLIINPYDANADIVSTIDLLLEPAGTVVTIVPIGQLLRIVATHENLAGSWSPETWCEITVESNEAQPRWLTSTVVNYDNNTANPVTPETGLLAELTFTSPTTAVAECLFDPSLIDLSNGVSITAKIKDNITPPDPYVYPITEPKKALLAYSTHFKLSHFSVYNGPIMRVRRKDDVEEDIPFLGTEIDTDFLQTFIGTSVGDHAWIVTWYDQSGGNRHATTSDPLDQPLIMFDGVILVGLNGFTAGKADGTLNHFDIPVQVATNTFAYFFVFDRASSGIKSVGLTSSAGLPVPAGWQGTDRIIDNMGSVSNIWSSPSSDTSTGNFLFMSARNSSADMQMNRDGVALPNSPINVPFVAGNFDLVLGTSPVLRHQGMFQELMYFNLELGAEIGTIEDNIMNRFTIS